MNKIGLIIKREYLRRVSKKSFILLTLLTPFLFAALVFVPLWLSTIKGDEVRNVAIIDTTGKYASLFENNESFHFIHSDKTLDEYRQGEDKEVFAFLSITDDLLNNPKAATLYSEKQVPAELSRLVNQTLSKQLESEKLASFNIPNLKEIIRESKINFNVQTIKWSEDGKESASSATVASIIGMVFTFIIYMFIMMYGAMVMQGVMEEKTNRIIDLVRSSVRPDDGENYRYRFCWSYTSIPMGYYHDHTGQCRRFYVLRWSRCGIPASWASNGDDGCKCFSLFFRE